MDEIALFYCNRPATTIATQPIPGMKQDKSRVTVALTVNVDGSDFREPLIIGKSLHPACFKKKDGTYSLTMRMDVYILMLASYS